MFEYDSPPPPKSERKLQYENKKENFFVCDFFGQFFVPFLLIMLLLGLVSNEKYQDLSDYDLGFKMGSETARLIMERDMLIHLQEDIEKEKLRRGLK